MHGAERETVVAVTIRCHKTGRDHRCIEGTATELGVRGAQQPTGLLAHDRGVDLSARKAGEISAELVIPRVVDARFLQVWQQAHERARAVLPGCRGPERKI